MPYEYSDPLENTTDYSKYNTGGSMGQNYYNQHKGEMYVIGFRKEDIGRGKTFWNNGSPMYKMPDGSVRKLYWDPNQNQYMLVKDDTGYAARKAWGNFQEFEGKLGTYDSLQAQKRNELLNSFTTFSEGQTGRALGGILREQQLQNQRRGIEYSGVGSGAMASAHTELAGKALENQQGFATQLMALQANNRDAYIRGEFSFMNAIDMGNMNQAFQRELLRLQEKLQMDRESRNAFTSAAQGFGAVLSVL